MPDPKQLSSQHTWLSQPSQRLPDFGPLLSADPPVATERAPLAVEANVYVKLSIDTASVAQKTGAATAPVHGVLHIVKTGWRFGVRVAVFEPLSQ